MKAIRVIVAGILGIVWGAMDFLGIALVFFFLLQVTPLWLCIPVVISWICANLFKNIDHIKTQRRHGDVGKVE